VSGWEAFWVGIAPEHRPALVAAVLVFVGLGALRRLSARGVVAVRPPVRPVPLTDRWAARLLAVSAAVHLALPLGHHDGGWLTAGFLGSGVAYAWVALRAAQGRAWRLPGALLVVATLAAYLLVVLIGGEESDQVGIATALVELTVFGLATVPPREPHRPRWLRRGASAAATVGLAFVVGAALWVGAFVAHEAADPVVVAAGQHAHGHGHAARAQAGVLIRPPADHHPSAAQLAAADRLAAETVAATRRYADLAAARAAGYRPSLGATGWDVHLENEAYSSDGRVLDPQRPEQLVYAVSGGRATLLGAVYVMERAGVPGPAPGGPVTGWHAHNVCLTAIPPGFGVVSAFGGCPALSVQVTVPEMMHVWTVDNPRGPYAEGLDEAWVRAYHARHGR
jgi:hypothetical protein